MDKGLLRTWFGRARTKPLLAPEHALPVLDATELLSNPILQHRVREIEQIAAVPKPHFEALYLAPLIAFAGFVQQLPASEAHHHAGPGGMLDHTLDVVVRAMKSRRAHLLPPGAESEDIIALIDEVRYLRAQPLLMAHVIPLVKELVALAEHRPGPEFRALLPIVRQSYYAPFVYPPLYRRLSVALGNDSLPIPATAAQTTEDLPIPSEENALAE